MRNEPKFIREVLRRPHSHRPFFHRPYFTRRAFFQVLGAGLTGSAIVHRPLAAQQITRQGAKTLSTAQNVIFILLAGAPSHIDTFDFKETPDSPLGLLKPETVNGLRFPVGIFPKLAGNLSDLAIVRSVRSWALQHNLGQSWTQIGRSPAGALGDIAPNMGAIVAIEKEAERKPGQVFPTFLALNSGSAVGSGYLSADYAPLKIVPATSGLPDTINPDGETRFEAKWTLLNAIDEPMRKASPYGRELQDYDNFYQNGRAMMFNQSVNDAFRFTTADTQRYGSTGFGNACLVASKVLAARGGTRYIMITTGGWDMHDDIYGNTQLPARAREIDNGLSQLIADLKTSGVFNDTLIVMMGEFGRTVGRLTQQGGRDHFLQQFAVFAGGGVRGGKVIGTTDAEGSKTTETGWSRERDIRIEDIEATIYSALGIDYTTVRYDDPFGRGFYYVPESNRDLYGPVAELFS